ncbi:MAG: lactate permease LctP family transporter [Chthoniobacteraceae bacterium]
MWSQNYTPLGGILPSALVAALPVVVLLALLGIWHVRAHIAALAGLATAAAVALFIYKMPAGLVLASAGYGAVFGLFPIGWIVLNAIFIYQLSVETGQFAVLKEQIAGVAGDRRIQALLVAFCFGAFIEGCAGFGAPVAITGAMLIGLGFKPLEAAKLALIGNTAPVAFGSLGIPITTLSTVTGLDLHALSAMVGRQLPVFSLIVPFWLVAAQVGWRGMVEVWPACFVCGASFAVTQFAVSNYHGPWLVDLASAIASLIALVALLRVWKPPRWKLDVERWTLNVEPRAAEATVPAALNVQLPTSNVQRSTKIAAFRAWLPWLMLSVFVATWTIAPVKAHLIALAPWKHAVPLLHEAVIRVPPVAPIASPEPAIFKFELLAATGTALLFAGIAAGLLLGLKLAALARIYGSVVWRVRVSLLTIMLMLALGFTTRYSGTDTTLGLALANTGSWFPFFSPLLGWLGVALTGSDTSSNVLFGNLQKVTAEQLHISPILTAAANSSGGVMGKMIDAQSIVVASVATGGHADSPSAGAILRAVFWHSLALALLVGVLVMLQARWFPGMIPAR